MLIIEDGNLSHAMQQGARHGRAVHCFIYAISCSMPCSRVHGMGGQIIALYM